MLPEVKDWERFSYNFFGSFLIYIISAVLFHIVTILYNVEKFGNLKISIVLILLLEISSIIMGGSSILLSIFFYNNYMSAFYLLTILITYHLGKKIFR